MKLSRLGKGLLVFFFFFSFYAESQSIKKINYSIQEVPKANIPFLGTPQIQSSSFKVFQINIDDIKAQISGIMHREQENSGFIAQIEFPHPDGTFHSYNAKENSTMHPGLAEKFPNIKSYDAIGENSTFVKWDITPHGLHVMILIPGESTIFIDPLISGNNEYYIAYRKENLITDKVKDCFFNSDDEPMQNKSSSTSGTLKTFGTCELRTYRLALSATGEYTAFHGGTVALAQAAQVTTMNRVNGVYERDMAITMVIIPNNNLIVYTNSGSDPFSNGNPGTMINQNQTNTDAVIGNSNYDIGHVFGTNSGGLAGLGVVCNNSQKARGVTGSSAPIGDAFDIDYVAHEMGHQFGGNHTFNNSCGGNRNDPTAVEPGSGTTIMAYAGICPPDIQSNSDDHFSGKSLEEIGNEILSAGHTCEVITPLANSAPIVLSTNGNVTIPANTPFALTVNATDPEGDPMTFNWEQMDNGISTQSPVATSTVGPNFRSIPSLSSPTRYFPNLVDLNAGGPYTWEVIPSVSRTMNFRVTVRDNSSGAGGCNDHSDITLTTHAGSGPFLVNYPSNLGITWAGLTNETVTWSVANTDNAPVACGSVDILLSTDGGITFPTILASGVPNDGSQVVSVPNVSTSSAIIMVMCSNGTFFDISDNPFTITMATFDYSLSASPLSVSVCQPLDATYTIDIGSIGGYNDPVTLSVSGLPVGATSNFSVNPVTPVGQSILTISNTGAAIPGLYTLTITGNSTTGIKTANVDLLISSGSPTAVSQLVPTNGATGVAVPTTFTWTTAPEIGVTYEIDIATDAGFVTIVDQASALVTATYNSVALLASTTYYWRVRSVTGCGSASWSSNFSFTTSSCSSYDATDVPITISASGAPTITSTINVPIGGTISDVNILNLIGTHTWIADLVVTIQSPLGTTVTLWDQICNNQNNFNLSLDDAATPGPLPCPPIGGGTYQPSSPLAAFNGEDAAGNWILTIQDVANQDGGSLTGWTLELCVAPLTCTDPDIPTLGAPASVCEGTINTLNVSSGNLNDATDWQWYAGSCGGTFIGSGSLMVVSPSVTTTYYVRGEGGCVTPGSCASITVVVNQVFSETASAEICNGDSYVFGNQTLTTSGTYSEVFTSVDGCDSTVLLTLNVIPSYNEVASVSICNGETYVFATQTLTMAGTYTELFTSVDGCDSLVILTLSVNPIYNENVSASVCSGDTYVFGTQTLGTAGVYTELFTSINGCDSTVTLILSVINSYNETASVTICDGTTYGFGAQALTTSGVYTELFSSVDGCDSTVVLTLTVNPIYFETISNSICNGDTYVFGTQTLITAGTYTELFTSVDGCDSTVLLTLTVISAYNETASASICNGGTYMFGTQALTVAGTYTELFASVGGCDSLVVLSLAVNQTYSETASGGICSGDTYLFGSQTLSTAGTYSELFTSIEGCDSLVILTLGVVTSYNESASATICDGTTYGFGSQALTTSGVYTELFSSVGGCDSTVVLTLTVNPTYFETTSASICNGDTYVFGTQTLTSSGTYTELFTSIDGCDSTVVLILDVLIAYNETASATICEGGAYLFGTQTLTVTGTYTELFSSLGGCDSIVVLSLTVNLTYNETVSASICSGETYVFGAQTLTASGIFTEIFTSLNGCDSLVVLTLNVSSTTVSTEDIEICQGSTYTFPDGTVGSFTQAHTSILTNINGCDSIIVTALTVHSSYSINESVTICAGDIYTFPDGSTGNTAQVYTSLLTTVFGCDSIIVTSLNIQNIDISVTLSGNTITATQTGSTYQWINCDNFNSPIIGEINQSFTATDTLGNYAVIVTIGNCSDTSNCYLIDLSKIDELNLGEIHIYPNPATDVVSVEWEGVVSRIEVTDAKGKIIKRIDEIEGKSTKVDVSYYSSGVYFIHVINDSDRSIFDIIKQ